MVIKEMRAILYYSTIDPSFQTLGNTFECWFRNGCFLLYANEMGRVTAEKSSHIKQK